MRSSRLAAAGGVLLAGLVAAACGSAQGPGWTYQPAASVTPAPSVSADASASAAPSGSGGGVAVAAQAVQFDTDELVAPADAEFQIAFDNRDANVPHDVDIRDDSGAVLDDNEIVTGPTQTTYDVPALPAGEYVFVCSVHPNMTGTLTAQ